MIGSGEIICVLLVVLILFGGKKLPELARSLGQGIREFKKASKEVDNEIAVAEKTPEKEKESQTTPPVS